MRHVGAAQRIAIIGVIYALFYQWRNKLMRNAIRNGSTVGPRWLAMLACKLMSGFAGINGVRMVSERGHTEVDRSKRYMITWHPHGFIVYCPIMLLSEKSIVGEPVGRPWHCTGATNIFDLPVVGDVLTLINGRPVDRKSLESIIAKGGSVAIQPGGIAEQAVTRHDQEQAFFPAKLGFVRMAIQSGTPILMLYVFGENQLFKRTGGLEWLTKRIFAATGLTIPIWSGKWGVPQNILPLATDIHSRWGNPVEVGPADPNPSDEKVEEVFQRYLVELQRLFYANCHECLPPSVASKGLKIVRMDKGPVPTPSAAPQSEVQSDRLLASKM
ncbi:unnamed protein product [Polarella glacialis]|uniref:Acyltransferase n=1 Tax=Polarella glacialis TaxID=89957 RepID=A0A813HLR3_POLGL|nr:unnamed protein product [Polarella glacialis]